MKFEITETTIVAAIPDAVFGLITDIARLPEWNREVRTIHEAPDALVPGAQWAVEIHAMGTHWRSRATVIDIDRDAGLFAYRSQSDDGNPSYSDWVWHVAPHADGAEVTAQVSVNPRSFWRRYLISNFRSGSLRKAVRTSLQALTTERTYA